MSKLPLLMGFFLSMTVTVVVFLMSILNEIPGAEIIFRCTIVFLMFGTLGTILGTILEIFVMPDLVGKETECIRKHLKECEGKGVLTELGDLFETDQKREKLKKMADSINGGVDSSVNDNTFDEVKET